MKTMTTRDLRLRWYQAEAALQVENEILITRDSQPVAKLVRVPDEQGPTRQRWSPEEHTKWMKSIWNGRQMRLVNKHLSADRGR